jgi:RND family efflux transporter MFP subunit
MIHDDELMEVEGSPTTRPWRRRLAHAVLAVALVAIGLVGGVVWSERRAAHDAARPAAPASAKSEAPATAAPKGDETVEVTLTPEAVERAGIRTAAVRSQAAASELVVPATVMSNAYRDTKVNVLVGGVVRQVPVELGAQVRRGQPLAVVFGTELAEAQTKYLSMQAMLRADHQKLERTEKLVGLGAASRQELEEVTATHAGHETEVAAARQRLTLLGLSPAEVQRLTDAAHIVSEVTVFAPADGVVIARSVNSGQVVNAGQELFVVTDLGTVWVIGDLYERDFAAVRVGSEATVGIPSTPDRTLRGKVAYIDPRVDPSTRTAKVRVEVPNPGAALRLGMYVTLAFQIGSGEPMTLVARDAVQSIGDRTVVYVAVEGEDGRFTERTVKLGPTVGESVRVVEGLKPGEKVVTAGSFFLRAEAARTRSGG